MEASFSNNLKIKKIKVHLGTRSRSSFSWLLDFCCSIVEFDKGNQLKLERNQKLNHELLILSVNKFKKLSEKQKTSRPM